eukprot:jgi/Botrbrau1/4886/Bobra.0032s0041.1
MDFDGRYYFFNGMFNHLRYPNLHTLFFTQMIWRLCGMDLCPDAIKEQILRIMLERLCRPLAVPHGSLGHPLYTSRTLYLQHSPQPTMFVKTRPPKRP